VNRIVQPGDVSMYHSSGDSGDLTLADSHEVTRLLRQWAGGDLQARDDLIPLVYRELRRVAARYLRDERPDHTLQPTALVHEAYVRLVDQQSPTWQNRSHFFGVAAHLGTVRK
jgi:RNA polymerase sigma factor (TIGR02999 family)